MNRAVASVFNFNAGERASTYCRDAGHSQHDLGDRTLRHPVRPSHLGRPKKVHHREGSVHSPGCRKGLASSAWSLQRADCALRPEAAAALEFAEDGRVMLNGLNAAHFMGARWSRLPCPFTMPDTCKVVAWRAPEDIAGKVIQTHATIPSDGR